MMRSTDDLTRSRLRVYRRSQRSWLCLVGCVYLYRNHTEGYPGLVVGTGAEDYFDSSYVSSLLQCVQ